MADRRDPARQRPDPRGRRAMDPTLTTRDVANRLGVSTDFVVAEIRDRRLEAMVLDRPGFRTVYRISEVSLRAYCVRYKWRQRPALTDESEPSQPTEPARQIKR